MAVKLGVRPLVLILLVVLRAAAQDQTSYFEIGGEVTLTPKISNPIKGITWKHKGNIVAEWIKDLVELEYLGDLKGRTVVDLTTGTLTIKNMEKTDEGVLTVEINSEVLPDNFNIVCVKRLGSPQIIVRPLTCTGEAHNCTLTCGDFQDVGPVQYSWKKGEAGRWEEGGKVMTIFNNEETRRIKRFWCKAKNPIREEESEPEENPLNKGSTGSGSVPVAGIVVPIVALVVGGVGFILLLIFRPPFAQALLRRFDACSPCFTARRTGTSGHAAENGGDGGVNRPLTGVQIGEGTGSGGPVVDQNQGTGSGGPVVDQNQGTGSGGPEPTH